jgi:hypothetical protein
MCTLVLLDESHSPSLERLGRDCEVAPFDSLSGERRLLLVVKGPLYDSYLTLSLLNCGVLLDTYYRRGLIWFPCVNSPVSVTFPSEL